MASVSPNEVPAAQNSNPRRINQYIGAIVASLGGLSLGVSLAWSSSAFQVLKENVLRYDEAGLVGGIVTAGACLGVLLIPWILRLISRTRTMLISIPVNIIGWAFICFANKKVWCFVIGRIVCGIAGGMFCVLAPLYIAEIADKNVRSQLLTFFQLFINFGIMYAFLVNHGLDERDGIWRYSLICAVACAPIALIYFIPESPLYHVKKGNMSAAGKSMSWYRGDRYEYKEELDEFEKLAKMEKPGFIAAVKMLKNRKCLRSLIVCHGVMIAQQLCGIEPMICFALYIFGEAGSGDILSTEGLILVIGGVQIVSCLLCTFAVDRIGRRVLLTISAALMGLFLILIGWYFSVIQDEEEYQDTYSWMPPTWTSLFAIAFNLGVGPLSWSMLADTFPMEIRLTAATSAAFLNWLISSIVISKFYTVAKNLGIPKTMWLCGGFSWIAAIFFAVLVRDNGRKSMLDIQTNFHTNLEESTSASAQIVEQT